jgi:hypothetical protein
VRQSRWTLFKAGQMCLFGGVVSMSLAYAGHAIALVPMFVLGILAHVLRWMSGVSANEVEDERWK